MKKLLFIITLLSFSLILSSCDKENVEPEKTTETTTTQNIDNSVKMGNLRSLIISDCGCKWDPSSQKGVYDSEKVKEFKNSDIKSIEILSSTGPGKLSVDGTYIRFDVYVDEPFPKQEDYPDHFSVSDIKITLITGEVYTRKVIAMIG